MLNLRIIFVKCFFLWKCHQGKVFAFMENIHPWSLVALPNKRSNWNVYSTCVWVMSKVWLICSWGQLSKILAFPHVLLFPRINHCGKNPIDMTITIIFGFDQIYLGKTITIHKWECLHECGKNHIIDQMINSCNVQLM